MMMHDHRAGEEGRREARAGAAAGEGEEYKEGAAGKVIPSLCEERRPILVSLFKLGPQYRRDDGERCCWSSSSWTTHQSP